eukprot:1514730-Alexandrium_andersonii.AAC.1
MAYTISEIQQGLARAPGSTRAPRGPSEIIARQRVSALIRCGMPQKQAWRKYSQFREEASRQRASP